MHLYRVGRKKTSRTCDVNCKGLYKYRSLKFSDTVDQDIVCVYASFHVYSSIGYHVM